MRLNKFLALAGIASRRRADTLIYQGLVQMNGQVVKQLGVQVDPSKDHVKVEGKLVTPAKGDFQYLLLHKPAKVMVTRFDPEGRPTVFDFLRHVPNNIFNVGRLDYDTEGLLLLTNDGELAHKLTHPKFAIQRTYLAKVKGIPEAKTIEKLRKGMTLEGKRLKPAGVQISKVAQENSWLEIVLTEGRNRQVRKMCEYTGHPVIKLKRVTYANLDLGDLPVGHFRSLTEAEVKGLWLEIQGHNGTKVSEPGAKPLPKPRKGWARPGQKKKKKRNPATLPQKSG